VEKRSEIRYQVDARALFSWEDSQHNRLQGRGITRDMSVLGAFILTTDCLPVEFPVEVEMLLSGVTGPKSIIRLTGVAHVLRVERSSSGRGQAGFAVVSEDRTRWNMTVHQHLGSKRVPFSAIERLKAS
jgi:hypothetical protein